MDTMILNPREQSQVNEAGALLRKGELVAIPTETVYGLAADALNPAAVKRIYEAKGRPADNPLIVHVLSLEEAAPLVQVIPETARKLAASFWPGPLTMILPKSLKIPAETSGGLSTVALRVPSHPVARAVIEAAGRPLAAPSANLSGRPSPTSFRHVYEDMNGRVAAIVDGGDCSVGVESTVITLATDPPRLLRPGGITVEQLREVLGRVEVDHAVLEKLEDGVKAASPGMKYKHYSPKAEIYVSELSFQEYRELLLQNPSAGALCFDGEEEGFRDRAVCYGEIYRGKTQARRLFSALHELDEKGLNPVYARAPQKHGVGLAVYNRLIRAAGFKILRPQVEIIGLTGPTGAGKSTVAQVLAGLGSAVIDCDLVTKDKKTYDAACIRQLQKAFGSDILIKNELDRKILAERAFLSPENTARLNEITLPVITGRISQIIEEHKKSGCRYIVLDAPTLFEAGAEKLCSRILVVTAERSLRMERIMKRDGISGEAAERRMAAQYSHEFYVNRSDFVIDTSDGAHITEKVQAFLSFIKL